ncbi:hypothetical protein [Saliphagus infecundisoli]|uniref:C2H2-type domain-containing protein n=1 Tax=Saliphagus infecundisoli TaxID=1849069 RepID=A0ABD5QIC6_9EURY|nr:hypothetical protein [Saliphagus infecundisoli]
MPDCRYCEQSFESESNYRSHLYHDHDREELGRIDERRVEQSLDSLTINNTSALEVSLKRDFTRDTSIQAIDEYTHLLWKTLEWEDFETLRDLVWTYYEPLATHVDETVKAEGWPVLSKLLDTSDPRIETPPPGLCHLIANVCGRYVIRRRVTDGVESIPAEALDYLQVFADRELPIEDRQPLALSEPSLGYLEWEASYAYGWGIGHSDHDVAARIHEVAHSSEPEWSQSTLEQAFYANQHAAAGLVERILQDPDIDSRLFFLRAVPFEESEVTIYTRYWDWHDELPSEFELAPDVITRLQTCVIEADLVIDAPEDIPLDDTSDP